MNIFELKSFDDIFDSFLEIREIDRESFTRPSDAWNKKALKDVLFGENYLTIVAKNSNNEIVGFVILKNLDHISRIAVKKEFRGRGVASELLEFIVKKSKKMNIDSIDLNVYENNKTAKNLYLKHGFKIFTFREDYYCKGENAVVMKKVLN